MTTKIIIIVGLVLGAFGFAGTRAADAGCVDLIDEHGHIEQICWAVPATGHSDDQSLDLEAARDPLKKSDDRTYHNGFWVIWPDLQK